MTNPELLALISRLRWPVPAVKWWVTQQLALLLLVPNRRHPTQEALFDALDSSRFETEAIELLFVFWLARARDNSFQCPANLACHVKARSPLSDAMLKSLEPRCTSFGDYLVPPMPFPRGVEEPTDFLAAEAQAFPRVLRSDLKFIEERTGLPLQAQFAFEWQASLSRVHDNRHKIDFFLDSPSDQYTGQFFTEQSARARSAFLRTLSVAGEHGGLPSKILERVALSTLPLDPALAWLQPKPPVVGLELASSKQGEVDIEQHITAVLSAVTRAGLVGAISWVTECSDNVWLDCTAMLWEGSAADWPENFPLEQATEVYAGMLIGTGLEPFANCKYENVDVLSKVAPGFRPLVGRVNLGRYGYMQAELVNRGIFAPIPHDKAVKVVAIPTEDLLRFQRGSEELGYYGYWNISWRPSHLRDGQPRCGTYLLLMEHDIRKSAFYAWRCRHFTQKTGYGDVSYSDIFGVLPLDPIGDNA